MKILSISGRNLASFADDFCLDLNSGALAEASLYSIVGPTGSGKSTLLDALCLALFGKTPRMAGDRAGENHKMKDQGGEEIALNDPRLILRRNAKEGFAQVDFVGIHGKTYRARWEIRRKRGQGTLDKAKHSYTDLQNAEVKAIEHKTKDEQILSYLGLSYEQFCRSVLLPQGDFAAFLKAKGEERAELLEALTGTEIYTEISKKAFQKNKEFQDQIKEIEQKLSHVQLLSDEELTLKQEEIHQQQEKIHSLNTQIQEINKSLSWMENRSQYQQGIARIQQEIKAIESQLQSRQDEFHKVQVFRKAQVLEVDLHQLQSKTNEAAQQVQEIERQQTELPKLAAELQSLQLQLDEAKTNLVLAQKTEAEALPKINEAQQFDAQLMILEPQVQAAESDVTQKEVELKALQSHGEALQKIAHENASKSAELAAQMAADRAKGFESLAQDWTMWQSKLKEALRIQSEAQTLQQSLLGYEQEQSDLAQILSQMQTEMNQFETRENILKQDLQGFQSQLVSVQLAQTQAHKESLKEQQTTLLQQRRTWVLWEQTHLKTTHLQSQIQSQKENLAQEEGITQNLSQELLQAETLLKGMQAQLGLEMALEEQVAQLRQHLNHGEACPVCGSEEHPFVQNQEWMEQIQANKKQRAEVEQKLVELSKTHSAQQALCIRLQSQIEQGQKSLAEYQEATEIQAKELKQLGLANPSVLNLGDFDQRLEDLAKALTEVETELARIQAWLQGEKSCLDQLQLLNQEKSAQMQVLTQKQTEWETLLVQKTAIQKNLSDLVQLEKSIATEWNHQFQDFEVLAWEGIERSLARAVDKLAQKVATWKQMAESREKLSAEIQTQSLELKHLQDQLKSKTAEYQQYSESWLKLKNQYTSLWQERESLWLEKDLSASKALLTQKIQAVELLIQGIQKCWDEQNQVFIVAQSHLQSLNQANEKLQTEVQVLHQALLGRMDETELFVGIPAANRVSNLAGLLAQVGEIKAIEKVWEDLQTQLKQAGAVLKEREQALTEHLNKIPVASQSLDQAQCQYQLQDVQDQLKQIEDQKQMWMALILNHQNALASQGQLIEEKTKLQSAQKIWKELDELIGSSDGKKFRSYAQQFTLGILLHQANRQLAQINPRYRLDKEENSLALVVVDMDMAEARRPIQSLSGGETFLVSLGLALGLSALSGTRTRLESLFIDEGFGTLDPDTLRVAMDALDALQAQGRKVGIITHVEELKERIPVQVRVVKKGNSSFLAL